MRTPAIACILLLVAATARAEPARERRLEGLGFARAIPRSGSASRDAPAFALQMAPRGVRMAGGELAVAAIPVGAVTLRPGFFGFIELEGNGGAGFKLWPSQEIYFWRASFAFPLAVSLDALGAELCAACMLEASLQFRHESEHYTGSNSGGAATDYSDRPIYGDAIGIDAALAARREGFAYIVRPALDVFLPDRSSYRLGPSLDVEVRYVRFRSPQPFVSGYAQYRAGTSLQGIDFPSSYLVRGLLGVALPSALGDVLIFGSADVGHRSGLAAYTREATLGFGVRLALGPWPGVNTER